MHPQPLTVVGVVTFITIALVFDLKNRRIPNWLTVPTAILGLVCHSIANGIPGVLLSLGGFATGFGILLILWLIGGGGGGGYIEGGGSTPVFTNCTITLNSPGGTLRIFSGSPQFTNSIIRGQIVNSGLGFYSHCITAGIVTSCTNCPGTNGNVDPLFTDAFNGDFST